MRNQKLVISFDRWLFLVSPVERCVQKRARLNDTYDNKNTLDITSRGELK